LNYGEKIVVETESVFIYYGILSFLAIRATHLLKKNKELLSFAEKRSNVNDFERTPLTFFQMKDTVERGNLKRFLIFY
jgi:hypothetical protein